MAMIKAPAGKQRRPKTTQVQYQMYLKMLESTPHFRENKLSPDNPNSLTESWEHLVQNLNASGGPQRTLAEWKRVFVDWKSQVRKKARLIKNSYKETGNQGEPETLLTELEKKLLYITGNVVVEGLAGVPEIGVNNEEEVLKANDEEKKEEQKKEEERKQNKENSCEEVNKKRKISKDSNESVLNEINNNLKQLINLKQQELGLRRLKI